MSKRKYFNLGEQDSKIISKNFEQHYEMFAEKKLGELYEIIEIELKDKSKAELLKCKILLESEKFSNSDFISFMTLIMTISLLGVTMIFDSNESAPHLSSYIYAFIMAAMLCISIFPIGKLYEKTHSKNAFIDMYISMINNRLETRKSKRV